jgi:ubiquinone/menaquinone biosynthesis C-methylase UbiE
MLEIITTSKQQVKNVFGERAGDFADCYADPEPQSLPARNLLSRRQHALEMVQAAVPRPSMILDAGCGTGDIAAQLMECGHEVWGVDIAEPMIRLARERCGSDRFRVGDLEQMPFEDNMFDAVVCLGVIEYLDSDEQALREMWRVLKPGGTAVIATPNAISPLQLLDRALLVLMPVAAPLYDFMKYRLRGKPMPLRQSPGVVLNRKYHRRSWLRLLRSLGLQPEEWICHGWGWYMSPLGRLTTFLSKKEKVFRRGFERFFGRASASRASDRFVRSPALNWLASEQIVRVRAIK